MISPDEPIQIMRSENDNLVVKLGKKKGEMTYQHVFSLGHTLIQSGHYELAETVFAALAKIRGRGSRAKIMLARCKAEIESFEACNEILEAIFDDDEMPVVKELEGAFLFHTMEMREEAIQEMLKVVKGFPDFPTAFLYLGDLFNERGQHDKAVYCWKVAVKRDRKGGAIAVTARKQLAQLSARIKKAKIANKKRGDKTPRRRRS